MHRGLYAFDPGQSSSSEVTVGSSAIKSQQQQLQRKVVPRWLIGAPRASAKAYVARVNAVLAHSTATAAELLFSEEEIELTVKIPTPLTGFTIAQLKLPKGKVHLKARRRGGTGKHEELDIASGSKLHADDEIVLCGTAHAIAGVVTTTGGKHILLKPSDAAATREMLKLERDALWLAAQEVYDRLLPHVRRQQRRWMEQQQRARAAVRIQASARGKSVRSTLEVELAAVRRVRLVGRLAARRGAVDLARRQLNGPILHPRVLKRLALPTPPAVLAQELAAGVATDTIMQMIASRQLRLARSHATSLNHLLGAAPEASALGVPMPLLSLLLAGPVTVTAKVRALEVEVSALRLPADVVIMHFTVNRLRHEVKHNRIDPKLKLRKGDLVGVRAESHRLALVLEAKESHLYLAQKQHAADATALDAARNVLLAIAHKLALWLQGAVRKRVAMRAAMRRSRAALVIQVAFAEMMIRRRTEAGELITGSFVKRHARHALDRQQKQQQHPGAEQPRQPASPPPHYEPLQHSLWQRVQKDHHVQIVAAGALQTQLKKVRQKKKPSQVKGRKPASPVKVKAASPVKAATPVKAAR